MPVVEVYGKHEMKDTTMQGGIIAFNLLRSDGSHIGYYDVSGEKQCDVGPNGFREEEHPRSDGVSLQSRSVQEVSATAGRAVPDVAVDGELHVGWHT
jgi:singapore isolate B (sub-type 7) whole genome shotgun sequence assembly, scaffold_10